MAFLYVKAYHGPCDTFQQRIHKPQRLHGLRARLQQLGFRVDLIPVDAINYCMLEMCGHQIFRCNLKHLKFNTSYKRDPVSERAIEAVMTSSAKFRRARAYLWFWTLLDQQLFNRNKYAPKDYWPADIHLLDNRYFDTKCLKDYDVHEDKREIKNEFAVSVQ